MNILQNSIRIASTTIFLAIFIVSCGTTSVQPQNNPLTEAGLERQVQQWLDKARASNASEREQHLLSAASLLSQQEQADWALNILFSIDDSQLNNDDYLNFVRLYSINTIATGQYFKAQEVLDRPRLKTLFESMNQNQRILFLSNQAHVNSMLGNYPKSLRERITLGTLFLGDQQSTVSNNEAIWQDLMILSTSELKELQASVDSDELYGWYLLATLSKKNVSNLTLQLQQLESWQNSWPQHPANIHLPNDLQLLRQLIAEKPTKIALLLPQQGRLSAAATAIRDGFFASYYSEFNTHKTTSIQQYDTSQGSIIETYHQAVTEGAELIIGPLSKEHVTILSQLHTLDVPVLALNYKEPDDFIEIKTQQIEPYYIQEQNLLSEALSAPQPDNQPAALFSPKLYQFGLATEDEARQIARQAYREGHRRAMIIAPDRVWATRSVNAFTEQWQAQNGQVVAHSTYVNAQNYSKTIKNTLLVNESEDRQKFIRRVIGESIEFEPRRRKDIDMIFLIANPAQARQIKPTLAFHYASHIPVYATNHIYTGKVDSKADRDLNGIRFNTLPWLFDTTSQEKQSIEESSNTQASYKKLNALGVDAFHLYSRLPQLEQLPKTRIFGSTGALSMDSEGRIIREQIWAQFNQGIARPLPTIASPDEAL